MPTISQDAVAPAAPSAPDLIDATDSGASQTDNITNVATPTFTGTAEPDSTVTISSDGVAVGSAAADSDGNVVSLLNAQTFRVIAPREVIKVPGGFD